MPYFLVFSRADSRYDPVGAGRPCGASPHASHSSAGGGVGDQCRLGVTHLERARAGQASAACSAPLPRLYACLPSGAARKPEGQPSKRPRGLTWVGVGAEVDTCEARGLGGGLRARFLHWDRILCMSTKRPTTKKQRSSPNPSSASNAEVGLDFRRGACGARFLLGTRARPDFLLEIDWRHRHQLIHHKISCGQPKFPQRCLHRESGVLRRKSSMLTDFE